MVTNIIVGGIGFAAGFGLGMFFLAWCTLKSWKKDPIRFIQIINKCTHDI